MKIALVQPRAPLHIGEATGALERVSETIHSDTLFGAICHAWGNLYGKRETTKLLEDFQSAKGEGELPFRHSSCFPFLVSRKDEGKRRYFLPSPLNLSDFFEPDFRKTVKKLRFIDKETYEKWVGGKMDRADMDNALSASRYLERAIGTRINVHVALDRTTLKGNPFYVSRLHFNDDSGLYFLYACREDYEERFKSALRLLGDMGIGGERSAGCGAFEASFPQETFQVSATESGGESWMGLSLVFPTEGDLAGLGKARVRLRERKGWISSPFTSKTYRRKRVYMFEEGSLFPAKVEGRLVDVTPAIWGTDNHPVLRYGLAVLIPARGEG